MRTLKQVDAVDPISLPLPSFSLTAKELPEIKNWSVGHKYKLEIEVEQTSMAKDEYRQGEPLRASFRITKIKASDDDEEMMRGKMGHE